MPHTPRHFEKLDAPDTWMYDSGHPGKTVAILGGVHGDEQAGPQTIRKVMGEVESGQLPVEEGRLIIIEGNPKAVKKRERAWTPGENLNRDFKELTPEQKAHPDRLTYEQKRAQQLLPLLDEADESLDLHEHHQKGGVPFIIGESNTFTAARAIGAPYIAAGFSKTEEGGSDGYMAEHGKPGLCFELGYFKDTKNNIARGIQAVERFLGHNGLIEHVGVPPLYGGAPVFLETERSIPSDGYFQYTRPLSSFDLLIPRLVYGVDYKDGSFSVADDGVERYIIFPNANVGAGEEVGNIAHRIYPDLPEA